MVPSLSTGTNQPMEVLHVVGLYRDGCRPSGAHRERRRRVADGSLWRAELQASARYLQRVEALGRNARRRGLPRKRSPSAISCAPFLSAPARDRDPVRRKDAPQPWLPFSPGCPARRPRWPRRLRHPLLTRRDLLLRMASRCSRSASTDRRACRHLSCQHSGRPARTLCRR